MNSHPVSALVKTRPAKILPSCTPSAPLTLRVKNEKTNDDLILFYVLFLAAPCGTQDLSYAMRDSLHIYIMHVLVVLGLHGCTRAFSNCGEQGLLFIVVNGLLIVVASLISEHRFWVQSLQ